MFVFGDCGKSWQHCFVATPQLCSCYSNLAYHFYGVIMPEPSVTFCRSDVNLTACGTAVKVAYGHLCVSQQLDVMCQQQPLIYRGFWDDSPWACGIRNSCVADISQTQADMHSSWSDSPWSLGGSDNSGIASSGHLHAKDATDDFSSSTHCSGQIYCSSAYDCRSLDESSVSPPGLSTHLVPIDAETQVPVGLFEDLVQAGMEARMRGQHRRVCGTNARLRITQVR